MKTFLNVRDRDAVLDRLAKVRSDAQPMWGTMSAHQMICHLSDSLRSALDEKYISPSTSFFKRTIMKPLALWVPIPWPHGFKTRSEMDQLQGGTPPVNFVSDVERLRILCARFFARDAEFAPHVPLAKAQREIAADWYAVYQRIHGRHERCRRTRNKHEE